MLLPQTISIAGQQVPSITVFLAAAFVYFFFVVWYEGKKDGFDIENLFNIFFLSIILASLVSYSLWRYLLWSAIYAYNSPLLKIESNLFVMTVFYLVMLISSSLYAKRLRWSFFKVVDIFGLAVSFVVLFYALGNFFVLGNIKYIFIILTILLMNKLVLTYRSYRFSSGISFAILNTLLGLYIFSFYFVKGHLLVGVLLVTISSVILYLRFKEGNMNTSLPSDLLKHLKNKLINKENELKRQDKLLKEEDPYMQPGRADENAENMDEAILEDSRRELTDANRNIISTLLSQVRKALAFIKMGKYGTCEICGNAIDKARLQIYPEATKCAECASKIDQQ